MSNGTYLEITWRDGRKKRFVGWTATFVFAALMAVIIAGAWLIIAGVFAVVKACIGA